MITFYKVHLIKNETITTFFLNWSRSKKFFRIESLKNVLYLKKHFFKRDNPAFFIYFVFSIQLVLQLIVNNITDDWIRTTDFWYRKRPLYQLHNTIAQFV